MDGLGESAESQRYLVSLNGDFADIVRYPATERGGIIALQLRGHPRTLTAILVLTVYLRIHPDRNEYRGKLLLVEASRTRLRQ